MNPTGTFKALRHRNFRLFSSARSSFSRSLDSRWPWVGWSWSSPTPPFIWGWWGAATLPVLLFPFLGEWWPTTTANCASCSSPRRPLCSWPWPWAAGGAGTHQNLVLCLIVFLSGTVMAFDIPACEAFIVDLVGKPDLPNAIALNSTLFTASGVIGRQWAGWLSPRLTWPTASLFTPPAFWPCSDAGAHERRHRPPSAWKPFLHAWKELLDYLWTRREAADLLLLMTLVAVFAMPYSCCCPCWPGLPCGLVPAATASSGRPAAWGPFWAV